MSEQKTETKRERLVMKLDTGCGTIQYFDFDKVETGYSADVVDGLNRRDCDVVFNAEYSTQRGRDQGAYFSVFNAGEKGYKVRFPSRDAGNRHDCDVLVGKVTEVEALVGSDDWKDTRPRFEKVRGYQFHNLSDAPTNDFGSNDGYVVGNGDVIRVVENGRENLHFYVANE